MQFFNKEGEKVFRFIKYFVHEWRNYKYYKKWYEYHKTYKNRLDYAFRNAKIRLSHCDCYGNECRKFGGKCDICNENKKGR